MTQTVSEFIFFKVKPSVKPEDPDSEEGAEFLRLMQTVKHQSGYQSSSWGRTVEDENTIAWVVDWSDARGASHANKLFPGFIQNGTEVLTLYVTLTPPNSETDALSTNPVTEICALSFPSSMTPDDLLKLNADLINFRTALMERLPPSSRPKSWATGYMNRPGTLEHKGSPSGHATVHVLAVGWESVEAHRAARETKEFAESIKPIRQRALALAQGLGMKHVTFRKL
ncbi:hypothetical protein ASPWEDRAFT_120319 [Aspergillus wentii DTO 134E9]|uniref:ABM domain-containing protein n=1 Tax=Aspergillus wentii DTO 134E9 TaxID=1073089 RepID=A0A1L9R6S9_ASPWE|nr:uncharacterized protein ASPWEDRAFT_120319 [Aspergillus wentii DTO 134E9]KAI9926738.1 hypothetical protein MW887_003832 [Aspergillus wentii]OJJ30598.1 hypothetical protein ASPWEDRAFT_120319 [Aspergillus wentii DTO 134E9]